MLLGAKHAHDLEKEVHFHFKKSSSKGLEPVGPCSEICFSVSSRREARCSEINVVIVFNRKWKRVWVRAGDQSDAFLEAPASKGWSCFYGKSLDAEEKAVRCTRRDYHHKAPAGL
jgi:hypothetical protein